MITPNICKKRETVVVRLLGETIFKRFMFGRGHGHGLFKKVMTMISDTLQNNLQNTKTLANQANSTKQAIPMSSIPKIGTSTNSVASSPEKSPSASPEKDSSALSTSPEPSATSLSKGLKPLELTFTSTSTSSSTHLKYLPKPETFSTSGSASLSDYERLKIEQDAQFGSLFKETCLICATKVIHHLLKKPLSQEEMLRKIPALYENVLRIAAKNKNLQDLLRTKGPSLIQHFSTMLLEDRRFDLKILKSLYPQINLDYQESSVPFALGLELFIFSKSLYQNIEEQGYSVISIDHKSPILQGIDGLAASPHDVKKSLAFTNQKNSDILYIKYEIKESTISAELVYKEVKSAYQGPKKGHIAVYYGLNEPNKTKEYMSQHIESLKNFDKGEKHFKGIIETLENLRKGLETKGDINAIALAKNVESLEKFNEALLKLSLEYKIPCTLAYDMPDDEDYITLYSMIEQAIKENSGIINIDIIFPKEKTFNADETRGSVKTIIEMIFPKEWRIELSENYNKLITHR
jgi:hypothetical protein